MLTGLPTLAVLAAVVTFLVLSAGTVCSCPNAMVTGTVRGTLVASGGPAGTPNRPVAGAVYFVTGGGPSSGTTTKAPGTFSITLRTGRYRVEGRSPSVGSGAGFPCSGGPVTVRPSATVTLVVVCPIK